MSYHLPFLLFLSFFFIDSFKATFGQDNYQYEIGFHSDNDAYLLTSQDRYYTNGIEFYFRKAVGLSDSSKKLANKNYSFAIGHKIYNAHSGSVNVENEVDRPITGYLYISGEMRWFFKNEDVFSFGSEVATIGPNAFGQNLQVGYHNLFGFYKIKGWQYQLNNAVGIDFNTSYSHLLFRSQSERWDGFFNANLSLGLNNTRVSLGPSFRYGRFNPMFESTTMGGKINSKNNKPKKEVYLFYRPQINWVIYNSTIQGGMLIKDKGPVTYNVIPLMLSQVIGVQWSTDRIGLNLNYTFNTKEVKSNATSHQYGSLSLAYYF